MSAKIKVLIVATTALLLALEPFAYQKKKEKLEDRVLLGLKETLAVIATHDFLDLLARKAALIAVLVATLIVKKTPAARVHLGQKEALAANATSVFHAPLALREVLAAIVKMKDRGFTTNLDFKIAQYLKIDPLLKIVQNEIIAL